MTQLLLIRHAKNDWVGDRLAGRTPGVHLNEAGRGQAAALAARLADHPLAAVYASPLERAQETAAFVAGPHGLPIRTLEGVGEVDFGEWTGRVMDDLRPTPQWAGVQFHPSGTRFPGGGETLLEAQSRAVAAIEETRAGHEKESFAIVSHADVIKAVIAHYAGVHIDLFQRIVISTASVSVIHFTPMRPFIVSINDTGSVSAPPKSEDEEPEDGKSQAVVAAETAEPIDSTTPTSTTTASTNTDSTIEAKD